MPENNKTIVNEVNEAFAGNRVEDFLKHCSDDIVWRIIGEKTTSGVNEISQMEGHEPPKFTVDEIVAEGDSVVCRGDMSMKGEDGVEGRYAYCDSYRFKGGKIVKLDSYVVKLKEESEDLRAAGA